MSVATVGEVEDFIADTQLDEGTSTKLRELDPKLQRELIDRGPLDGVRDPSAVVQSRMKALTIADYPKRHITPQHGPDMQDKIDQFVSEFNLDERASQVLQETEDPIIEELISRPHLCMAEARNPSAVMLAKLSEIRKEARAREQAAVNDQDIDDFVKEHDLDERAETALRESETWVLQELLNGGGSLADARNASAVVLTRLRDIIRAGNYQAFRFGGGKKGGKKGWKGGKGYGYGGKSKSKGKGDKNKNDGPYYSSSTPIGAPQES